MKTGQWHVVGYLEPHGYVRDALAEQGQFAPLGWKQVYSSDRLIILRNVTSGHFNVLVDDGMGDDKWKFMIPANITTLRQWLTERDGPDYAKEILRNK